MILEPVNTPPSETYQSETYKGVEIRIRCVPLPQNGFWSGNYSFFMTAFGQQKSQRICRQVAQKFATKEDGITSCFAEARLAVDREISSDENAAARAKQFLRR
jgi:hypothetical protein